MIAVNQMAAMPVELVGEPDFDGLMSKFTIPRYYVFPWYQGAKHVAFRWPDRRHSQDDFAYNSHPSIAVLDNGEWLAVFGNSRRRDPHEHPPGDPLFRNLLVRTADRGATWSEPTFVPDFDWYGVECPGIVQLANGTVVLSQFRFGWYPLGLARQRRAAGEPIYLSLPDRPYGGWTEDFTEADWERAQRTWARGLPRTLCPSQRRPRPHLRHGEDRLYAVP